MKRLFILLTIILINTTTANAINWQPVYLNGKICSYVDVDSITKNDRYFFYNALVTANNGSKVIVTIQSSNNLRLSARINHYQISEYTESDGDYKHIFDKQTTKLEPVLFGSVVNAINKYVKTLEMLNTNSITINP